jgi:Xaa-Pro aminopeptidase
MPELVVRTITHAKHRSVAFEADEMTVAWREHLGKKLKNVEFKPTSGLVEQLRMIKDAGEIEAIRDAIACAHRAFDVVRASLRPEQTEKQVADAMEYQVRLFDGDCTSFTPIIAVGHRAALPHYRPAKVRISESEFVLIDWGARVSGYVSDLTRILVTGKISPKLHKVYGVVAKAQALAIAAIKHGALLKEVDAAARGHIESCGFGKQFGHGLGHGIGMQVHEAPRMGPLEEAKLQAGMVVTVEPGVYIPGWGGVRLEDDVLVTRTGAEVLSRGPQELEACVVGGW